MRVKQLVSLLIMLAFFLLAACGEKKPATSGNPTDSTPKPVNPCPTGR
ncbi:MAG: hypothetical protein ABIL25_00695 [candidate division WOR-3 bacterium]